MRKKIAGKIFCGNTKSQLFSCRLNLDISDDPLILLQPNPQQYKIPLLLLAWDCGFENRLAHNMARTASFWVSEYQSVSCSLKYRGITDKLYFFNGYYKSWYLTNSRGLDFPFVYFLGYEIYRTENQGRFPFNQTFRKFGNRGKWYRNFQENFPEILETVEFPKCEPFKILPRNPRRTNE